MERPSLDYLTLADIAEPSALLIIRLGVKTSPNKEMPNVLIETLRIRDHEKKPTWVWDGGSGGPGTDTDILMEGHRAWSPQVMSELSGWTHLREGDEEKLAPARRKKVNSPAPVTGEVTASNWLTQGKVK